MLRRYSPVDMVTIQSADIMCSRTYAYADLLIYSGGLPVDFKILVLDYQSAYRSDRAHLLTSLSVWRLSNKSKILSTTSGSDLRAAIISGVLP